ARISGWGEKDSLQPGLRANENEERFDGTSQAQPGYGLSCQAPPTSRRGSMTRKSSSPVCFRRAAMPSPENPVPMMRILASRLDPPAVDGGASSAPSWALGGVPP